MNEVNGGVVERCQRITEPVNPVAVNVGAVPPEQIVAPPVAVPPTLEGVTVTIKGAVESAGQAPF